MIVPSLSAVKKNMPKEKVTKLQFGAKSTLFAQDSDSAQIVYSQSSMSICAETEPVQNSSNLASKASFATPSKIILYADQGVDGGGLRHLIASFREIINPTFYSLQRVKAKDLVEEGWEEDTALLVIPGGRDIFYHALLNGRGTDKIRSFIEKGGKYLGICAGAYFACETIEFEKGGILEVCASRSLRLFPGIAMGPAFGLNKYSYENHRGAEAAKISWKDKEFYVYFNGGCTFAAEKKFPFVRQISSYLDLNGHPPAMMEIEVGKGLALLSGVHFEYSVQFLNKEDQYLSRLYPLLSQSEDKRKILFGEILKRLGISLVSEKKNDKCAPIF